METEALFREDDGYDLRSVPLGSGEVWSPAESVAPLAGVPCGDLDEVEEFRVDGLPDAAEAPEVHAGDDSRQVAEPGPCERWCHSILQG